MSVVSSVSHQKSWQSRRQRVSVLAEMALRKETIVRRLIALREQHGLTQEQAAQKVGVTSRQWQRWESGDSVPYPRNLDQIASRFGVTVAEFFDKDGDHRPPVVVNRLDGDLEDRIATIEDTLAGITRLLREARSEQDRIGGLAQQAVDLVSEARAVQDGFNETLQEQTSILREMRQATQEAGAVRDRLVEAAAQAAIAGVDPRAETRSTRRAASKTARKHSRQASKPGPA